MVQQDPVVIADSVLANVTLGRNIEEEAVWRALETVQLADLVRGFPQGIHTRLGEQGNNLSVGQKQLLAMARVLVQAPQILISTRRPPTSTRAPNRRSSARCVRSASTPRWW